MRSHCRLRTASTSTLRRGAGQKWTTTRPKDRNEGMSGQYVEFFNDIGVNPSCHLNFHMRRCRQDFERPQIVEKEDMKT